MREGRIPPSQRQQLYNAFKDKAVAAKAAFESGLHNQLSLGDAAASRCSYTLYRPAVLETLKLPQTSLLHSLQTTLHLTEPFKVLMQMVKTLHHWHRGSSAVADHGLDFELPFASKFLLLAAYVCSRNKPALDRRLFDPSMRGTRRRGAMASDKQVTQPSSPALCFKRSCWEISYKPCPPVWCACATSGNWMFNTVHLANKDAG